MNHKANESPKIELRLNLSPPGDHHQYHRRQESIYSSEVSPRGSCVSQEVGPDGTLSCPNSPPDTTSARTMMLVGCPRCLMYVMLLSQEDPKCPKCKSNVLLDFQQEDYGARRLHK